jgi:ribosomal protein L37AE/L43A
MLLEFYACHTCGKVWEIQHLKKIIKCAKCGSRRFHPVYLGAIQLTVFLIMHPTYLLQAIRGH